MRAPAGSCVNESKPADVQKSVIARNKSALTSLLEVLIVRADEFWEFAIRGSTHAVVRLGQARRVRSHCWPEDARLAGEADVV